MIKAYAKVNLSLKVVNLLPNNYHALEAINVKINLFDEILIKEDVETKIEYKNFRIDPAKDTILKVIKALQMNYNIPNIYIQIKKNIPVGSGLAGMSSDIAEIVKCLNKKYKLKMTNKEMQAFLLPFGTDIIYCLLNKPALVKGIGDIVIPLNIKLPKELILINPNIKIETKDIYNKVATYQKESYSKVLLETLTKDDLISIYINDLEQVTLKENLELSNLINDMKLLNLGKLQMTGSGSSFILLSNNKDALSVLKNKYPDLNINKYKILK